MWWHCLFDKQHQQQLSEASIQPKIHMLATAMQAYWCCDVTRSLVGEHTEIYGTGTKITRDSKSNCKCNFILKTKHTPQVKGSQLSFKPTKTFKRLPKASRSIIRGGHECQNIIAWPLAVVFVDISLQYSDKNQTESLLKWQSCSRLIICVDILSGTKC